MNSIGCNPFAAHQSIELDSRQTNGQQTDAFFVVFFFLYRTERKELRTQSSKTLRQAQGADEQIVAQQFRNRLLEQVQTLTVTRRQPDPLRLAIGIALDLRLYAFEQIEFVIDLEDRQVLGTDLAEHRHDLFDLRHAFWLVSVDHVQQQVGVARLFERSPKCLDQLVRQVTDEAHGVRQNDRTQVVQFQTAQGRVEGGEQLVGRDTRRNRSPS